MKGKISNGLDGKAIVPEEEIRNSIRKLSGEVHRTSSESDMERVWISWFIFSLLELFSGIMQNDGKTKYSIYIVLIFYYL